MHHKSIVIVDDNPTTVFYNRDLLEELYPNAIINSFENATLFVNDVMKNPHKYGEGTLILLDINMPDLLGYEVLEKLEEELEELLMDVIMVTSSNLKSDVEKSTRFNNIIGYIEKPLTEEKISTILNGGY